MSCSASFGKNEERRLPADKKVLLLIIEKEIFRILPASFKGQHMRCIRGKLAVITGAGSGLGRAIARRLAAEGARLHLADIDGTKVRALADEMVGNGLGASVSIVDLSTARGVEQLVMDVHAQKSGPDILVNNAGIGWYGPTHRMPDEQWDRLMALNLDAPIRLTRRLLPSLLARPEAHVINMASICGWVCSGRFAAYHVSKFGLIGFSEALRAEYYRQGLGVTAVCPGPVLTDLYKNAGCLTGREVPQPPAWLCTTPERVAAKTVRAIYRGSPLALVGGAAYLLYYAKRLAPGVFYSLHGIGRKKHFGKKAASLQNHLANELSKAA
jgi:short-subunit dehydrogenase